MKYMMAAAMCVILAEMSCLAAQVAAAETEKQPVFLLCPKHERFGAWSLYFVVDKADPSKPLSLGLEELSGHNSEDDKSYDKVLQAQQDPATPRVDVGSLDAKLFGSGSLRVDKNKALNVTCTPTSDGFTLMIDMRTGADTHFVVGGPQATHHNVVLKFDKNAKKWGAFATVLENNNGINAVGGQPLPVTGLTFTVISTGIYKIVAALKGGNGVIVYDRSN